MKVAVSFTDPDTMDYLSPSGRWFGSGVPENALAGAAAAGAPADAIADLCRKYRAASVTFVGAQQEASQPVLVSGKGVLASHERFHVPTGSGWYVTDHFRNAASQVPVAERRPSEVARAEHYIFRSTHGDRTYAETVDRVTHGEVVTIDLSTGAVAKKLFDKLIPPAIRLDHNEALDRLDRALAEATNVGSAGGRPAVLFSGGVDSTLLMTYLHPAAAPVTWIPDSPEFAHETAYARSAADLLGATITEAPVREADYRELLEQTTEITGWPSMHYGTPMFAAAYDLPFDSFFMGEGSDALFGNGMRLAQVAGWLSNPVGVAVLRKISGRGPKRLRHRVDQLLEQAPRLAMEPGPRSFALGSAGSETADELIEAVGSDPVIAALEAKYDYVDERIDLESQRTDTVWSNFEYRHWIFTLADPVLIERHQAQGRGKAYHHPFGSPGVVETALAVPLKHRYIRRLRGKWMVKELLARRLPGYPIDQKKGFTWVPFERLYASGPLLDIWTHYEVPEIFTGKLRDEVVKGNRLTWQAIAYSVWDAHIGSNASLTPHQAAIETQIG